MDQKKILIVDDDPILVKGLTRVLNDAGYDILTAKDGSEAVSVARHEKPDLILLDVLFPPDVEHGGGIAWDGFLIMDWLRRQEETKSVPIFMITMGDTEKYRNIAFARGAAAFFHKPIDRDELLTAVRQTLGEVSAETTLMVRLDTPSGQ
jgi:CheY-like chemotaxis protein